MKGTNNLTILTFIGFGKITSKGKGSGRRKRGQDHFGTEHVGFCNKIMNILMLSKKDRVGDTEHFYAKKVT